MRYLRHTSVFKLLFLPLLLLASCVIEISDLTNEELARLVNLRVVAEGNRTVDLTFNTNPNFRFDLLRSPSLRNLQTQALDTSETLSLQNEVVCLDNTAMPVYRDANQSDTAGTSSCIPVVTPPALANDSTYYYVLRVTRTDETGIQNVFYSNLVAATPRPDSAPDPQPLNGGIPSNRVGGVYGEEVILIFDQLTLNPADGLQEYDLYNASISRDDGCDYAQFRSCAITNPATTLDRIALDNDQIGSTPYVHDLINDVILDSRDQATGAASTDLRLPLYYQIGITNSFDTSFSNELSVERFDIVANTPPAGSAVELTLAGTEPVLLSWAETTSTSGVVSVVPNALAAQSYRVFYGETLATIDANFASFSTAPTFLVGGLTNGVGYWFKVVADYVDTSRNNNQNISRLSIIVNATPTVLPATPQIAIGYTDRTEAFFDTTTSTTDATAFIAWYPTLSDAIAQDVSTRYTLFRITSPVATTSIDSTASSNGGTEVSAVTKLPTPVTVYELVASSDAGTVISEPATISRFLLRTVPSSAQISVSWGAQLTLDATPVAAIDTLYDVYVTTELASNTIDATASRVANDLITTSFLVTQVGSGINLTNGETYVIKVVGKKDLDQDGDIEYAVSELVSEVPQPLPDIRTLSAYFYTRFETSNVAVIVATPQTIPNDSYTMYHTANAIDVTSCDLFQVPSPTNCAGIVLTGAPYTSPGTIDVGFTFNSRFFTMLATNSQSNIVDIGVQSESVELTKIPLTVTQGATEGSVDLLWPAVFGLSTSETYTIYYSDMEATVDSSATSTPLVGITTVPATHTDSISGLTVGATHYFKVVAEATGLATPITPVYLRSTVVPILITSLPTPPVITNMQIVDPFTQTAIFTDVAWDLNYQESDGAVQYQLVCSNNSRPPLTNAVSNADPISPGPCNYTQEFIDGSTSSCERVVSVDITPNPLSETTDTGTTRVEVDFGRWKYCSIVAYDTIPNPRFAISSQEETVLAPVQRPQITDTLYSDAPTNTVAQVNWTIQSTPAIANYAIYYYTTPIGENGCTLNGTVFSAGCNVIANSPLAANTSPSQPGTFTHAAGMDANIFYTIVATSDSGIPVPSEERVLLTVQPTPTAGPNTIQLEWVDHTPSLNPSHALCIIGSTPLTGPIDCDALYTNRASQCDRVVEPFASGDTVAAPNITVAATHNFYVLSTSSRSTGRVCSTEVTSRAGVPERPIIVSATPGYYINAIDWNDVTEPSPSLGGTIDYVLYRSTAPRSQCDYVVDPNCPGRFSSPATTVTDLLDDVRGAATPTAPATFYYTVVARNDIGESLSDEATVVTVTVPATVDVEAIGTSEGSVTVTTPATDNTYEVFRIDQSEPNPTGCVEFTSVTCSATSVINPLLPNQSDQFATDGTQTYIYIRVTSPIGEVVYLGPHLVEYEQQLRAIEVGSSSACVITVESSHVLCWGMNNEGQLGNGATSQLTSPTINAQRVITENGSPLTDVMSIGVGWEFACALQSDGDVYCWGKNDNGQIGSGSLTNARFTSAIKVNQTGRALENDTNKSKQITVGKSSVCVIRDIATGDDQILCWGSNSANQLAQNNGDTNDPNRRELQAQQVDFNLANSVRFNPDSISMSNDAADGPDGSALDADSNKTCAAGTITAGGTSTRAVFCWGSNASEHTSGAARAISPVPSLVQGLTGTLPADTVVTTITNNNVPDAASGWSDITSGDTNIIGNFSTSGTVVTASGYSCAILQESGQQAVRTWNSASDVGSLLLGVSGNYAGQFVENRGESVKCWGLDGGPRNTRLYRLGRQVVNVNGVIGNSGNFELSVGASDTFGLAKLTHYAPVGTDQTFTISTPATRTYPIALACGGNITPATDYANNRNDGGGGSGQGDARCTVSGIGPQANVERFEIANTTTSINASVQDAYEPRQEVFVGFTPVKLRLGYAHACALLQNETDSSARQMVCWGSNEFNQISHLLRVQSGTPLQSRTDIPPESRSIIELVDLASGSNFHALNAPYILRDDTSTTQGSVFGVNDASAGNNETCVITNLDDSVYCFGQLYNSVSATSPATITLNRNLF